MRPSQTYDLHPTTHSLEALPQSSFDVIYIGSGWAGRVLASRVAKAGLSVLIVEKEVFGGDSLSSAKAVDALADAKLDAAGVFRRRDKFILNRDDDKMIVPGLLEAGISLVRGEGKISGTQRIVVTSGTASKQLDAKIAVTPRDASSAVEAPAHLIIVCGGVVGCEMATAYASFGSKVTLISSTKSLLPSLDNEVGMLVAEALRMKGVQIMLGRRVVSAARATEVVATLSGLDVGLDTIGIQSISTSQSLQVTGAPWLYALGDANGLTPFTHAAKHHGRTVANAILGKGQQVPSQVMPQVMPQVIFTQPTVASVGLTTKAAKQQGVTTRVVQAPYQTIASSIQEDGDAGMAQCIFDEQDRILGFTFVGHNAGEVIHAGTAAIVAKMRLLDLVDIVPSFPTCAEVYLNLLEAAGY